MSWWLLVSSDEAAFCQMILTIPQDPLCPLTKLAGCIMQSVVWGLTWRNLPLKEMLCIKVQLSGTLCSKETRSILCSTRHRQNSSTLVCVFCFYSQFYAATRKGGTVSYLFYPVLWFILHPWMKTKNGLGDSHRAGATTVQQHREHLAWSAFCLQLRGGTASIFPISVGSILANFCCILLITF